MANNNIRNYSSSVALSVFILQPFIQQHVYKASFLAHVISVYSVFGPINGPMWAKRLHKQYIISVEDVYCQSTV